ncbi:MAG: DUF4215 domain-containing protein [Candidatus Nanoarchaeia archaeon]|nr:DUF4215 domain-containing protein [Candidatus Nanoarchaeia archaeon]
MPSKGDYNANNSKGVLLTVLILFLIVNLVIIAVYLVIPISTGDKTDVLRNIATTSSTENAYVNTLLDENNIMDDNIITSSSSSSSSSHSSGSSHHDSSPDLSTMCWSGCGINIDKECRDYGFDFGVAKWECFGTCCGWGSWVLKEQKYPGSSVTGCCSNATWNAGTSGADGIIAKGGLKFVTVNGTSGILGKINGKEIDYIIFCGYNETQEPECGDGVKEGDEECEINDDCDEGYTCNACICIEEPECCNDTDCPKDFHSDEYCYNNDVYWNLTDYFCDDGNCLFDVVPELSDECGSNSEGAWNKYCIGKEVWKNKTDVLRGCNEEGCFEDEDYKNEFITTCDYECVDGNCTESECGDGIVNDDEECEPPNTSTCDADCMTITCDENSDCGEDGWVNQDRCVCTKNIWDFWNEFECENPGTADSYCTNSTELKIKQDCGKDSCTEWEDYCKENDLWTKQTCYDRGCVLGTGVCFNNSILNDTFVQNCGEDSHEEVEYCYDNDVWKNITEELRGCEAGSCTHSHDFTSEKSDECGEDEEGTWNKYCIGKEVWRNKTDVLRGCSGTSCFTTPDYKNEFVENCTYGCEDGSCVDECCDDGDCLNDSYSDEYCYNNDIYWNLTDYFCDDGECLFNISKILVQDCGNDSCDAPINYCENNDVYKNQTCYDRGCELGGCFNNSFVNKSLFEDCGENSYGTENYYCIGKEVWRNKTDILRGCSDASCYTTPDYQNENVSVCEFGCKNGNCTGCEHDVGIRYSYGNSFETGIAIGLTNGTWLHDPVELIKGKNYTIKYYIDNKIANTTNNIHVIVKIDETIIADYNSPIDHEHSKSINISTSSLLGEHNISVYAEKINETDCNMSDNYAKRKIIIKECCADGDCPNDSYSDNYCINNNVYRNLTDYFCKDGNCMFNITSQLFENCGNDSCDNFGNQYCKGIDVYKNQTCYDRGCELGGCFNNSFVNETFVKNCGNESYSDNYCKEEDVVRNHLIPGCSDGECFFENITENIQECGEDGCDDWGEYFCDGKNKTRLRTCYDKGCSSGSCFNSSHAEKEFQICGYACINGSCIEPYCGDGIVNQISEQCDDGNLNNFDECRNNCILPKCGDNILDSGEQCDDGNNVSKDGCSSKCKKEGFPPIVWMCDSRVVYDDQWQPGTTPGEELIERQQNYAFEGEQIKWKVLVMDKNGIEKMGDVFVTIGDEQGEGNDIESNCHFIGTATEVDESCNARIGEENLTGRDLSQVAGYYECTLNVETAESMYGQYWVTVEADDLSGLSGTMDENEYWFFNPLINLNIEGDLSFGDDIIMPGTTAYSTITIENDADENSGVRLEMYIAGTNFFDSSHSGAMCPTSNVLDLKNFRYFATNGYYSTANVGGAGPYNIDDEGYSEIPYGDDIKEAKEIIGTEGYSTHIANNVGNVLTPGSEMSLTFKLNMPEPCNGNFEDGNIYFWGEPI